MTMVSALCWQNGAAAAQLSPSMPEWAASAHTSPATAPPLGAGVPVDWVGAVVGGTVTGAGRGSSSQLVQS